VQSDIGCACREILLLDYPDLLVEVQNSELPGKEQSAISTQHSVRKHPGLKGCNAVGMVRKPLDRQGFRLLAKVFSQRLEIHSQRSLQAMYLSAINHMYHVNLQFWSFYP